MIISYRLISWGAQDSQQSMSRCPPPSGSWLNIANIHTHTAFTMASNALLSSLICLKHLFSWRSISSLSCNTLYPRDKGEKCWSGLMSNFVLCILNILFQDCTVHSSILVLILLGIRRVWAWRRGNGTIVGRTVANVRMRINMLLEVYSWKTGRHRNQVKNCNFARLSWGFVTSWCIDAWRGWTHRSDEWRGKAMAKKWMHWRDPPRRKQGDGWRPSAFGRGEREVSWADVSCETIPGTILTPEQGWDLVCEVGVWFTLWVILYTSSPNI